MITYGYGCSKIRLVGEVFVNFSWLFSFVVFDGKAFNTYQAITCPHIETISSSFDWIPQAVPSHLSKLLARLHGAPFVWFIGQLGKFLMRPSFNFPEEFKIFDDQHENPVVGIHVRRTDKVSLCTLIIQFFIFFYLTSVTKWLFTVRFVSKITNYKT